MKNVAHTIEDLLEVLAGLKEQSKIQIETTDATIMHSIARQVFKGTALTDRQFALMKEKLQTYRDQFITLEYDFDRAVDTLRQPLRHIDRSKYIKIVSHTEMLGPDAVYESYKNKWQWIKIRFPFSKSLITVINSLPKITEEYHHAKGSHEHFFLANETNIYNIIKSFKDKEFDIEKDILDYYQKCEKILNEDNNISYINDVGVFNISQNLKDQMHNELGEYKENIYKYTDRHRRYGVMQNRVTTYADSTTLKIASRERVEFYCPENEYSLNDVLLSIYNLDRFPLLVNVSLGYEYEQVQSVYEFFKTLLPSEQQSVMFRLDNADNREFNEFVQEKKLNNWVDNNTKIVYINNKLTKVLMKSQFSPITTLMFSQNSNGQLSKYIRTTSDLIVIRAEESLMRKYSKYHGFM